MSSSTLSNKPRVNRRLFVPSARCLGGLPRYAWTPWLAASMLLTARLATAQEALRTSLAGDAAAEARRLQLQSLPYTVKSGDFRLLVTPSLELDWNDNINLSSDNTEADFILRPSVALNASYPLGTYNLLNLSVDFGYDKYINHDEFSQWYLSSGSELSFDVYIKDFWINFHDRFQCSEDSAQESAVAGTGSYGTFQNTAGLSGTWDLEDVTLTLGYDHQNVMSLSDQFNYINHVSELVVARAGLRVHPKLTIGVEGTASFTTYDQAVLNDNQEYSAGIYGDWRPGSFFSVQPRLGYTIFDYSQTNSSVKGGNLTAWYANLTLVHQATDFLSYSLSAGHEIRLGIQSDAIEDSYIRPSANWNVTKNVTLQPSLFYEHGVEGGRQLASLLDEKNYDWYGGGLSLSYSPMKKVRISLNYRLTLRSSDVASREYTQNMVGLQITYTPQ
ncbi:MAG: hypothetical protein ABSE97_01820 [Verrucomicrobiota bacterium]|jgi:hypothetical protein